MAKVDLLFICLELDFDRLSYFPPPPTLTTAAMSSLHESHVSQKPIETIHPNNLPESARNPTIAAGALQALVEHSTKHADVKDTIHAPMHRLASIPFVSKLIPGIEDLAAQYHVGNYVQLRGSSERFFESMPIYPR